MSSRAISVVIPTLASEERRESLLRAISCVRGQTRVQARPMVVINGNRYDPQLRAAIERDGDVDCRYLSPGDVGLAQQEGVKASTAPYFSFLDDDDLLLPGGLAKLCDLLECDSRLDYVAGDGFLGEGSGAPRLFSNDPAFLERVRRDPAASLLERNWLASCGGLFRRSRIDQEVFDASQRFFEWTYYAFVLACNFKGGFCTEPVFRLSDTVNSASKSLDYARAYCPFLVRLEELAERWRPDLVGRIHKRLGKAYHDTAVTLSRAGERREALVYHRRAICMPGGWRYVIAAGRTLLDVAN